MVAKGLEPLTRVAAVAGIGLFINVKSAPYNAAGDGTTDDRTAIQAADTAAAAIGAAVYFPGTLNGYLVTGSVRPSSGVTWFGDGYKSMIKCPDAGWVKVATTNVGIINIDNKTNVRITGLRVRGTLLAPAVPAEDGGFPKNGRTPKIVYLETYTKVMIDHCWFENTYWEGIWEGGTQSTNRQLSVINNYFEDMGWDVGPAACAATLNCDEAVASSNTFYHVGQAVGAAGARITVVGNQIRDVSGTAISTGDAGESGLVTISSNVIEFTEGATPRRGIFLEGGSGSRRLINVVGNVVHLIGTGSGQAGTCYASGTAENTNFSNNLAEIEVKGVGFSALGSTAGTFVNFKSNTVRVISESGSSIGFTGIPNGSGKTLNVTSENNNVYGMTRAQSSLAFDYRPTGGGTLNAHVANDFATEGGFLIGDIAYNQFGVISSDNKPMFDNSVLTSFSAFLRYPELGVINFQAPFNTQTIASGAITLSGSASSYPLRQTRVKVNTEAGAGTDDLDTINGGLDGDLIMLQTADDARDVVVKHNTGNISCGSDVTLSTRADRIALLYDSGLSKWVRIDVSSNNFSDVTTFGKGIILPTQTGVAQFGIDESAGTQLSIANDATATPFGNANNFSGLLMINDPESTGGMGLFIIGAGSTVVLISQAGSLFTTTQGTASSVNVYANAGVITIENKRGATIGFRVFAIRMRNSG